MIDAIGFVDNVAETKLPGDPLPWTFTQYGKSGIPVFDWFPHVGVRHRRVQRRCAQCGATKAITFPR